MKMLRAFFLLLAVASAASACSEPPTALPSDPIPAPQPNLGPSYADGLAPPRP